MLVYQRVPHSFMWLYHHNVIIIFPMKMRIWRVQPMFFCDIPWTKKMASAACAFGGQVAGDDK